MFSPKRFIGFFLKLLMKLWWVKGKKLTESGFLGKNLMLDKMLKNILKTGLFGFCKKLVH